MLMEFNGRPVLWGALAGFLISLVSGLMLFLDEKTAASAFWVFPVLLFGVATWLILDSNKQVTELTKILGEKRKEISEGEVYFNGQRLHPDIQMVQFRVFISMVVVTFTISSRPHLYTKERPWLLPIGYSFLSLMLGMWSYKGVINAPISAYENTRFIGTKSIGDMLLQLESWGKQVKIGAGSSI